MSEQQRGPAIHLDECWTMHLNKMDSNKMDSKSLIATYVHEDGTFFNARFYNNEDIPCCETVIAAIDLFRRVKALFREGAG